MTLEFNRIVEQIYKMGSMLEKLDFDLSQVLELAYQRFQSSNNPADVWERIQWVRQSSISGYRGATPLDLPNAEPINGVYNAPNKPERATIISVDGSQVYPDELSPVHYYLINIGMFVFHHGIEHTPEQFTYPDLRFHRAHVHDKYGRIISNRTVDDRRTLEEMKRLAQATWDYRRLNVPMVALYDNRLMYLPSGETDEDMMGEFFKSMEMIRDSGAYLSGYIDNPHRSKRFTQLLFLMSIQNEQELHDRQLELSRCGDLEGLRDRDFFSALLEEGQRSAVMVQNSPQNKEYRDEARDFEIAFFYLKVYSTSASRVVRVDIPMWVARNKSAVDAVHSLILEQCRMQGRNPYPYAITRADELAYVGGKDSHKLEELINVQIRRTQGNLVNRTLTAKMRGKEIARSSKRYHNMMGQEMIDDK
jgi:hypothetical protein